jgi:hypothetical protein
MGVDYSYNVTKAKIVRELATFGNKKVLLCNVRCEDEHGHRLAKCKKVVVVLEGGSAKFEQGAENFLPEDKAGEFDAWQKLCDDGYPGYDVYDEEAFAALLQK